jgi:hypothetical protein
MTVLERAKQVLDDPNATREQLEAAYCELEEYGAEVSATLQEFRFDFMVAIPGVPRLVGEERRRGARRLLHKITGR